MDKHDRGRDLHGTQRSDELLGGHASNSIWGGSRADVIWGDYKPCCQPTSQFDHLYGGAGDDFIFASHGTNYIDAGAGDDWVKAHWGRGVIDCGPGHDVLYISRRNRPLYRVRRCETISHKTLGYSSLPLAHRLGRLDDAERGAGQWRLSAQAVERDRQVAAPEVGI